MKSFQKHITRYQCSLEIFKIISTTWMKLNCLVCWDGPPHHDDRLNVNCLIFKIKEVIVRPIEHLQRDSDP